MNQDGQTRSVPPRLFSLKTGGPPSPSPPESMLSRPQTDFLERGG
jgi:hypothetical protein